MKSRIALVVAAFGLTTSLAQAQTVVAGQVIHRAKRAPLPNVSVELLGARDTVLATAVTSPEGTFALLAPAGGTYRVRLTAPGAETHVSDSLTVTDGEYSAHAFPFDPEPRALFEFEVDRPVIATRSTRVQYPDVPRSRGISGCVLAQWVVDTTGRADTTTFTILKASEIEFAQAVRDALPRMRFTPAEAHGRKVRQLVQQPFDFSIVRADRGGQYGTRAQAMRADGQLSPLPPAPLPEPPLPPPPSVCGKSTR